MIIMLILSDLNNLYIADAGEYFILLNIFVHIMRCILFSLYAVIIVLCVRYIINKITKCCRIILEVCLR